jgi:hypothetical protein
VKEKREKVREAAVVVGRGLKKGGGIVGENIVKGGGIVGRNIAKGGGIVADKMGDAKLELERKTLQPVFLEELLLPSRSTISLDEAMQRLPKMIIVGEQDKKRKESPICIGSIGHMVKAKGMEVLNLYEEHVQKLGVEFFPTVAQTVYYKDPYQENFYIGLDDYFDFLQKARISELEMVAHKLGAKRMQISFKERKKQFVAGKAEAKAFIKGARVAATHEKELDEYASIEIAADVRFSGHDTPEVPTLVYFRNVDDIEKLIKMRTDGANNRIEAKVYKIQCEMLSGIKKREAMQIDSALQYLKLSGTASISSEVQRESRTVLEYRIEF